MKLAASFLSVFAWLAQTQPAPGGESDDGTFWAVWGVLLIGAAIMLFFVEVVVPAGGLIGLAGAAALVTGVVLLFRVDTTFGLIGAIAALIALPIVIGLALKVWPDLPVGRLLILRSEKRDDAEAGDEPEAAPGTPNVGRTGEAMTDLRPIGTCVIDGKRQECLASGGMIEAGEAVRVVSVDGMQIKVAREPK
ncbi:MAG: hypothetical protein GVY24_02825 [Planctomycetes bacterium]|jgi:membrane-bound serine protease (ClpP class)|nr:hypothetical protein [Planctomycetota bacterium]